MSRGRPGMCTSPAEIIVVTPPCRQQSIQSSWLCRGVQSPATGWTWLSIRPGRRRCRWRRRRSWRPRCRGPSRGRAVICRPPQRWCPRRGSASPSRLKAEGRCCGSPACSARPAPGQWILSHRRLPGDRPSRLTSARPCGICLYTNKLWRRCAARQSAGWTGNGAMSHLNQESVLASITRPPHAAPPPRAMPRSASAPANSR